MLFHYSHKKLFSIFLVRFIPSLVFLYIALWVGEVFWIATILLWVEALMEVVWRNTKGYCKITEDHISSIRIFDRKKIDISDIRQVFTYDGEWTFRNAEKEIRINRNYIRKSQLNHFDEKIKEIQIKY